VAQPQRLHLAHEAHLTGAGQVGAEFGEESGLALGLQLRLELDMVVEVVLDRRLVATRDEDEVLDPRRRASSTM
jgi:hypothetical protein